jgi:hypothetical protein
MRLFPAFCSVAAIVSMAAAGVRAAPPEQNQLAPAESASESSTPAATATAKASASPSPSASAPPAYEAWQGAGYGAPNVPPPSEPPPPVVGEPEYSRRPVELVPRLGVAFPNCKAGTQSDDRCQGVGTGGFGAFSAFWRVTPHFAWGGGFEVAGFTYNPPQQLNLSNGRAGAVFLGLAGRIYFNDEGTLDPFIQLGTGVGALGTTFDVANGDTYEETGAGPAVQVGGGLDFYLSRSLRIGPTLLYTRVFVDKIRRCRTGSSGECVDLSKDADGHLNAYLTLGASLTIMLGEEL